ncbi:hypothetical protein [Vibrio harveyi]|uniref:hypothetical protein n=1 Tax=Vibrio harveyi TaxID=669 RepID=UPI0006814675|nr:hypothetical protein [Vibrio harveyi]
MVWAQFEFLQQTGNELNAIISQLPAPGRKEKLIAKGSFMGKVHAGKLTILRYRSTLEDEEKPEKPIQENDLVLPPSETEIIPVPQQPVLPETPEIPESAPEPLPEKESKESEINENSDEIEIPEKSEDQGRPHKKTRKKQYVVRRRVRRYGRIIK